jgi:hypothetical protein
VSEFAKNIEERDIIYWVQGLCPNREKSLALGGRGLEGLDQETCPSANFNDCVLKPVAARLRAKMVYCNIRDVCIRDGVNCLPATTEEAKRLAEVIGVIAKLAHQKKAKFIFQNCGGKSIKKMLIPEIKKVESSAPTIAFVNEDSFHLSFYDYLCNVCFFTRELQEYRIYLDLQNIYEDMRKAAGDDPMPFKFDELLNWARPLEMVVDHHNKTPEMMEVLQNEWKAKGLVKIAPLHRSIKINRLKRKLEMLTESSNDTTEQKKSWRWKLPGLNLKPSRNAISDRRRRTGRRRKRGSERRKRTGRRRKRGSKRRKRSERRKRKRRSRWSMLGSKRRSRRSTLGSKRWSRRSRYQRREASTRHLTIEWRT